MITGISRAGYTAINERADPISPSLCELVSAVHIVNTHVIYIVSDTNHPLLNVTWPQVFHVENILW